MPGLDGLAATRRITAEHPARVLVLTTYDLDEYVYDALQAGASGFLLKDTPPAQLADGIRAVAGGEALLAPTVTRRHDRGVRPHPAQPPGTAGGGNERLQSGVRAGLAEERARGPTRRSTPRAGRRRPRCRARA